MSNVIGVFPNEFQKDLIHKDESTKKRREKLNHFNEYP